MPNYFVTLERTIRQQVLVMTEAADPATAAASIHDLDYRDAWRQVAEDGRHAVVIRTEDEEQALHGDDEDSPCVVVFDLPPQSSRS